MVGVGTVLAGKFRIDRPLGQGGMGAVFAATNILLGQRVALKLLLPEMCAQPAILERFVREARASAQLRGDHVCRVSDVGTLENGAPYIVMEMLEGRDLSSVLASTGPLRSDVLCDYVLQACLGVAEAHALGIVHRDLKPANLFLAQRPDGTTLVKVLDFGIAKAPGGQQFDLTQTAAVMGSPGYMSPEQLRSSRNVDARSDIWSIGTILYELATGRTPFTGESITELAVRVSMDPTPPLPDFVPAPLQHVIYRCLEKNPDQRFQNLAALAVALAPFVGQRGHDIAAGVSRILNMPVPTPLPPTVHAVPTTLGGASGQLPQTTARKGRGAIFAGVGIAAAIAVAAVVIVPRMKSSEPAAATTRPADAAIAMPLATVDAGVPVDAAIAASPVDASVAEAPPVDAGQPTTRKRKPKPQTTKPAEDYDSSRY